jgi:hypothetical protein
MLSELAKSKRKQRFFYLAACHRDIKAAAEVALARPYSFQRFADYFTALKNNRSLDYHLRVLFRTLASRIDSRALDR